MDQQSFHRTFELLQMFKAHSHRSKSHIHAHHSNEFPFFSTEIDTAKL